MKNMKVPAEAKRHFQRPGVDVGTSAPPRGRVPADRKKNCNIKVHEGVPGATWLSQAASGPA